MKEIIKHILKETVSNKVELYRDYVVDMLIEYYTEVGNPEGRSLIYFKNLGWLADDCEDLAAVKYYSKDYNPKKYWKSARFSETLKEFGITDVEEEKQIYITYLEKLSEKYCKDTINESEDKETYNELWRRFKRKLQRISDEHDPNN
jgi:hypothetical protein